jgi:hypothetical protein
MDTKPKNPEIPSDTHHRQNHLGSIKKETTLEDLRESKLAQDSVWLSEAISSL